MLGFDSERIHNPGEGLPTACVMFGSLGMEGPIETRRESHPLPSGLHIQYKGNMNTGFHLYWQLNLPHVSSLMGTLKIVKIYSFIGRFCFLVSLSNKNCCFLYLKKKIDFMVGLGSCLYLKFEKIN